MVFFTTQRRFNPLRKKQRVSEGREFYSSLCCIVRYIHCSNIDWNRWSPLTYIFAIVESKRGGTAQFWAQFLILFKKVLKIVPYNYLTSILVHDAVFLAIIGQYKSVVSIILRDVIIVGIKNIGFLLGKKLPYKLLPGDRVL